MESKYADRSRTTLREHVDLPTGHRPQLTRPEDLARAILRDRRTGEGPA